MSARTFHVLHGYSAAGIFHQALPSVSNQTLVHDDVLSCGPLPPFESPAQWAQLRSEYWDEVAPGEKPPSEFNREFVDTLLSLNDSDSVVFWVGIGAAEQLMLTFGAHLLRVAGSKAKLHVVQFTRIGATDFDVWGLGLLNVQRMANHPPIEPLSADAIDELERNWTAVTSPDPTQLLGVISSESGCLPHWSASVRMLIHRYPGHRSGLSRFDYALLKFTEPMGPRATRIIGEVMGRNFDADLAGDSYLFWRLRRLASAGSAHPLVTLSGDPYDMRNCEVALTQAGHQVLAGHANAIQLNGVDDRILGVHLDSRRGAVWCQKDGTLERFSP